MSAVIVERGAVKYAVGTEMDYSEAVITWGTSGVEIAFNTREGQAFVQFHIGTPDDLRKADDEKNKKPSRDGRGTTPRLPFQDLEEVG